ncbi:MAG: hypothetical protein ACYC69_09000 [Thermodesulfovibrionales bacterium]
MKSQKLQENSNHAQTGRQFISKFAVLFVITAVFILLPHRSSAGKMDIAGKVNADSQSEYREPAKEQGQRNPYVFAEVRKRFASPAASPEFWYVLCNKSGTNYQNQNAGRIELGKQLPADVNYLMISHSSLDRRFNTYESAKSAVNQYCPSWRCNWNGGCVASGGGGKPDIGGCPPGTRPGPWGQCY